MLADRRGVAGGGGDREVPGNGCDGREVLEEVPCRADRAAPPACCAPVVRNRFSIRRAARRAVVELGSPGAAAASRCGRPVLAAGEEPDGETGARKRLTE